MKLGVNYWPRRKAMYWWKEFDRNEAAAELTEIAALGLDVVRIFLFWEDFQPRADAVGREALRDLGAVLDVAREVGVLVMPTFFTGHMSGINFWPEWALSDEEDPRGMLRVAGGRFTTRRGRDPYEDPMMLDAEERLVDAVCGAYGEHPAVWAWNFANEPDLFATPRSFDAGARWSARMARAARRRSPRPVTTGVHLAALVSRCGFRPDQLAPSDDHLSMHAYSIYWPPTESSEPLCSDVVPLACLVTESLGKKPVVLEEFGYASSERGDVSEHRVVRRGPVTGRQYFADDASGGAYYREVLEKLARVGAAGAFAWMFSDYAPSVWTRPPFDSHEHERFFGITRHDGTLKPSGEALREFAARARRGELPPRVHAPLPLDPDDWYRDPGARFEALFRSMRGRI